MKIGFRHNTDEWDRYIADVRKKFPEKVKLAVAKTTQDLSRHTKASVPVRYSGIKASVRSRVQDYSGEVSIGAHYAPYVEFGTGRLVQVPTELREYAMQFKGKGIREVNRISEPYFYPNYFIQRKKFFDTIERGLKQL